ncbi:hypothetical protein BGZ65_002221 [Modicella reniformis]|uniref:F-box domain-containing protein n=1 Tax=Modicella reniformis TaxID=1440133 RepID=A0A9P6M9S0_9FUNG|nr:hypothetical protein BGZ65_002221 [Modicella reniformis]
MTLSSVPSTPGSENNSAEQQPEEEEEEKKEEEETQQLEHVPQEEEEEERTEDTEQVQQNQEPTVDVDELTRQKIFGCRATNPMELHEIRVNVARFLSRRDIRSCLLVCESWWESFSPFLWMELRPVNNNVLGGANDYPQAKLIRKYGHLIRTFEYNGHGTVLQAMLPNERPYTDVDIEWNKTREEGAEEESWLYADEDVDTEIPLDSNETLSEYEERIERNRNARMDKMTQFKRTKAANERQNRVSRFLNDNTDYRKRVCDHIEKLIFTEKRFSRERGCHYRNWIKLMQINQGQLRCLELTFMIRSAEAYRDIFEQILALENLEELVLVGNDMESSKMKRFMENIGVKLTRLELRHMRVDYDPFTNHSGQFVANNPLPVLTKMKSLSLVRLSELSNAFVWKILAQCPNVVELDFRAQWSVNIKEFSALLSTKMPNITHLGFSIPRLVDMDLVNIFKALPTIEKLDVAGSEFGMMAINHLLGKNPFTISYVDLRNCSNLKGHMILRILGECRNLRSFMADSISANDMVNNTLYSYSWACIGLRELVLDIRGDPKDEETCRKIYRHLSQLTCLEHLDITELLWMVKAWPLLGEIGGKLKPRKVSQYNPNVHPKEDPIEGLIGHPPTDSHSRSHCVCPRTSQDGNTTLCSCAAGNQVNPHEATTSSSTTTTGASSSSPAASTSSQLTTSSAATSNSDNFHTRLPVWGISASADRGIYGEMPPGTRYVQRVKSEPLPRLMTIELRRLKLNHQIKVIPHNEDKLTTEQRKRFKHLFNDSEDEEPDRGRPHQPDTRYRYDIRDW